MKKLLLASVIAIASAASVIGPANAGGSVTIGIGNGYDDDYYYRHHRYSDYDDEYVPRYRYDVYDEDYRPRYRYHHRRCHTEVIRHWRHHHRIIERIRVCRR
ncbi:MULTISPECIES: hypothetical protein [unclassified Mesorhizobium]|uniref:hypothetical protein n=1 Tax=unclassified Mesorhizobium TaxID=325217 RepID=UPI00333C1012